MQSTTSTPLLAGAARRDITCLIPGLSFMGWAMHFAESECVEAPLWARAVFFQDPDGHRLAFVHVEVGFITLAVRQEVLHRLSTEHPALGIGEHNLVLTANHTHCAPGGLSDYILYSITVAGFSEPWFRTVVNGIVEAVVEAFQRRREARLHTASGRFADDIPVAFNRAWEAYSANPDAEKVDFAHRHLAVDRNLHLLAVVGTDGQPIAQLNWFAVHTTSVHNDKRSISPDNKGHAARRFEAWVQQQWPGCQALALFNQAASGDVTPNFQRHPGLREVRGTSPDDYESMRTNGDFQFELAREVFLKALGQPAQSPVVDAYLRYENLVHRPCDPDFTPQNRTGCTTGEATLGISFMTGTREGEGVHGFVPGMATLISQQRKLANPATDGARVQAFNLTRRSILGQPLNNLPLPSFLTPDLGVLKRWGRENALGKHPMAPPILPAQLVQLGPIALAVLPAEPTTQSGRRLVRQLQPALAPKGVTTTLCMGYSNAFAGYIVTFEEYQLDGYEAGSTHFGQFTLAAWQSIFKELAGSFLLPRAQRPADAGLEPLHFDEAERRARAFRGKRRHGYATQPVPDYRQHMMVTPANAEA